MTKLTNSIREEIIKNALHVFDEERLKLAAVESDLAEQAWKALVPEEERNHAMSLPRHWFRKTDCFWLNAGGYHMHMDCNEKFLPTPYYTQSETVLSRDKLGNLPEDHPVSVQILAHKETTETFKKRLRDARTALQTLLSNTTTTEKLKEVWPEGLPFYTDFLGKLSKASLPAVQTAELNRLLNLGGAA
jgi:hypothetical protein